MTRVCRPGVSVSPAIAAVLALPCALYATLSGSARTTTGFAQRAVLSALHRPDGSEAGATIMRRGFMAVTLEPSGAVVTVGPTGGLVPSSGVYQTLGAYAPAPGPPKGGPSFFWDVLGGAPRRV